MSAEATTVSAGMREVNGQIDKMISTTASIQAQRDDARAALRDIIFGCDGMLQPALNVKGSLRGFIEEVKRVATAGLQS